ncbi:hypothetical protein LTR53_016958 [Teratosphaeriaceae sp. CCFEE 6253]|nr:hypothetical protein LTR53_016958 [Teratosphaeriaceae sp. CCFEE 6253]
MAGTGITVQRCTGYVKESETHLGLDVVVANPAAWMQINAAQRDVSTQRRIEGSISCWRSKKPQREMSNLLLDSDAHARSGPSTLHV